MKKETMAVAALLLMFGGNAHANVNPADDSPVLESEVQEVDVQRALEILARAKVIVMDERTHRMKLRSDMVEKLRAAGKLEQVYASMGSFCM